MQSLAFGTAESAILFVALIAGLGIFAWVMQQRTRAVLLGARQVRWDRIPERAMRTLQFAFGQWRMPQDLAAGLFHMFIFWGFLVVSIRTVTLFAMGLTGDPSFHLPLLGPDSPLGLLYNLAKDLFELLVVAGVAGAAWRRLVVRPRRLRGTHTAEAVAILATIFLLMLTDIVLDGILLAHGAELPWWAAPVGYLARGVLGLFGLTAGSAGAVVLFKLCLWLHLAGILGFLNYLPFGKHFHVITSIPNVFASNLDPAAVIHRIEGLEERETFGATRIEDLGWKALLDVYSCTECGRCVEDCPTDLTEKPLSHRALNLDLKAHLAVKAPLLLGRDLLGRKVEGKWDDEEHPLAGDVISEETIWACTTCGYCESRCPVLIENLPRVIEMRRHLTLMQGKIPTQMQTAMRGLERNSNPWNIGMAKRGEWAADLEVPVLGEGAQAEYLFFVGCAASFDERARKVARSLARILKQAGVSFAILGPEEGCCGDPARRLGNEYLAQAQIEQNVETFKQYSVQRILTACPHCAHVLGREYGEFGAQLAVTHAAVFVRDLAASGKLKLNGGAAAAIAYHDSCYLGRHHGITAEPRALIAGLGAELREPHRHGRNSFCCGAGGGRMWLEETGKRVSHVRFAELAETGAGTLAVSCPFCLVMMEDAAKETGVESVQVRDLIELVAERLPE